MAELSRVVGLQCQVREPLLPAEGPGGGDIGKAGEPGWERGPRRQRGASSLRAGEGWGWRSRCGEGAAPVSLDLPTSTGYLPSSLHESLLTPTARMGSLRCTQVQWVTAGPGLGLGPICCQHSYASLSHTELMNHRKRCSQCCSGSPLG